MADVLRREELERKLARRIGKQNQLALEELMGYLGDPPDFNLVPPEFWQTSGRALRGAIAPVLEEIFIEQAELLIEQAGFGIDWTLVNELAVNWAKEHGGELIANITDTVRKFVGEAVADYFEEGLNLGDLRKRLERVYGPKKAEEIATTEVTRAASEGEVELVNELEKSGIVMKAVWQTSEDDLVCPVCGPLADKEQDGKAGGRPYWIHPDKGQMGPPPAHPRCRCWLNHKLED